MTDNSFSTKLRLLSKDYYQQHVSFEEYRAERKRILDQIDEEFNGHRIVEPEDETREQEPSLFLKTIAFFNNKDLADKGKTD